ncbi:MAG: AAA family ATPase, partial [Anaerolineales bacterium]
MSAVLIGGDPGIGKSTLLLQAALEVATQGTVLYVSGEESERQIKMRAARLLAPIGGTVPSQRGGGFPEDLFLVTETNLNTIFEHVTDTRPRLLVIDSIQTAYMPELESSAGSVTQVRETASRLRELAKSSGIAVFIIGPRVLEHIVDTVLYLEGDRF